MTALAFKSHVRPVELMFSPDDGGLIGAPNLGAETPRFGFTCPNDSDFDLSTPEGLSNYVHAVNKFGDVVETFEARVDGFGIEVEAYAYAIGEAFDNAEQPSLFTSFTSEDAHRAIDAAGILNGDEVIVLLRGHYDRLVGDGSACVFDSRGACIHRECGLERSEVVDG